MKLVTIKPAIVPEEGDYKIIKRFAWWPRKVENKIIWLEFYKKVYCYKTRKRTINFRTAWYTGEWAKWDLVTEQLLKK